MAFDLSRRSLITGLISLVAAPAIVRAGSLMPIKVMDLRHFELIEDCEQVLHELQKARVNAAYEIARRNMNDLMFGSQSALESNSFKCWKAH